VATFFPHRHSAPGRAVGSKHTFLVFFPPPADAKKAWLCWRSLRSSEESVQLTSAPDGAEKMLALGVEHDLHMNGRSPVTSEGTNILCAPPFPTSAFQNLSKAAVV
jgi:hypothetical protein